MTILGYVLIYFSNYKYWNTASFGILKEIKVVLYVGAIQIEDDDDDITY